MGILEEIKTKLDELTTQVAELTERIAAPAPADELGDITMAVQILKLKRGTILRKCLDREIPFYQEKPRAPLYFKRSELIAHIEKHHQPTAEEMAKAKLTVKHRRTAP